LKKLRLILVALFILMFSCRSTPQMEVSKNSTALSDMDNTHGVAQIEDYIDNESVTLAGTEHDEELIEVAVVNEGTEDMAVMGQLFIEIGQILSEIDIRLSEMEHLFGTVEDRLRDSEITEVFLAQEPLPEEQPMQEQPPVQITQLQSPEQTTQPPPPAQTTPTEPPVQTTQAQSPAQTTQTQLPVQITQTQPVTPPPAQTTPTQPPVQITQTPPITPPPAQTTPTQPPVQITQTPQPVTMPQQVVTDGPASRVESLTQTGMTPLDSEITFSRIVYATVGQILEIPFHRNGWVYLGEIASRRGIVYNSRRGDSDGQSFIFTLETAGTYILSFYRQDFIRDYILNDHVQVIVAEAPEASTGWFRQGADRPRIVAQPRWPTSVEEAQILSGSRSVTEPVVSGFGLGQEPVPSTQGVSAPVPSIPDTNTEPELIREAAAARIPPDVLLQRAQETFNRGNIIAAIELLDQCSVYYPYGNDELFWLYGQFYEANSPNRNILLSLDYYRRLVNEYPQSRHFIEARRRIAHIERFYINIQ